VELYALKGFSSAELDLLVRLELGLCGSPHPRSDPQDEPAQVAA
jgi:hypothetical protein